MRGMVQVVETGAEHKAAHFCAPNHSAERLASLAVKALVDEVRLTPKPALVDLRGSGAHADLSLTRMLLSARVLEPFLLEMALAAEHEAASTQLREQLGAIGRRAEEAMLAVTGGVNTHRGAIWSMGLLVAAAAMEPGADEFTLCDTAGRLSMLPDRHAQRMTTHGALMGRKFGATGAFGEARAGFPHVLHQGLPALRFARLRMIERDARLHALFAIMSKLEDTCLLHRGGEEALRTAREGACAVLEAGGYATENGRNLFAEMDARLMQLWASPGGSADLLAATLFVDSLGRAAQGDAHD